MVRRVPPKGYRNGALPEPIKIPEQRRERIGILMGSGQGPVSSFFFLFLGPEAKGRRKCQVLARAPLNVALG